MGNGTELNKSEIERLSQQEPIINNCFRHGEIGGQSYVEKLECMVLLLTLEKNHFQKELIDLISKKGS